MKGDDDSEEEDTLSLYCLLIVVLDVSRIVDGRLFVSSAAKVAYVGRVQPQPKNDGREVLL